MFLFILALCLIIQFYAHLFKNIIAEVPVLVYIYYIKPQSDLQGFLWGQLFFLACLSLKLNLFGLFLMLQTSTFISVVVNACCRSQTDILGFSETYLSILQSVFLGKLVTPWHAGSYFQCPPPYSRQWAILF